MNVAVVLAGGEGTRVGAGVPKQFVRVLGREVLSWTLERFERHPEVDAVEVVCRGGWEGALARIVERDGARKVRWVAEGGATFQESVAAGLARLEGELSDDDTVLVHYGASPFVGDDVISDALRVCAERGNASPARALTSLAAGRGDGASSTEFVDRDRVVCLNSPQALRFGYARWLYAEGERRGLLGTVDPHTTSLMLAMGEPVYFSRDSSSNIKITTADDLRLFEGWLLAGGRDGG